MERSIQQYLCDACKLYSSSSYIAPLAEGYDSNSNATAPYIPRLKVKRETIYPQRERRLQMFVSHSRLYPDLIRCGCVGVLWHIYNSIMSASSAQQLPCWARVLPLSPSTSLASHIDGNLLQTLVDANPTPERMLTPQFTFVHNAIVRSLSHREVTWHRSWTFPFVGRYLQRYQEKPIMTIEIPDKMYPANVCTV